MYPRILTPKIIYCTKPNVSAASVTSSVKLFLHQRKNSITEERKVQRAYSTKIEQYSCSKKGQALSVHRGCTGWVGLFFLQWRIIMDLQHLEVATPQSLLNNLSRPASCMCRASLICNMCLFLEPSIIVVFSHFRLCWLVHA